MAQGAGGIGFFGLTTQSPNHADGPTSVTGIHSPKGHPNAVGMEGIAQNQTSSFQGKRTIMSGIVRRQPLASN